MALEDWLLIDVGARYNADNAAVEKNLRYLEWRTWKKMYEDLKIIYGLAPSATKLIDSMFCAYRPCLRKGAFLGIHQSSSTTALVYHRINQANDLMDMSCDLTQLQQAGATLNVLLDVFKDDMERDIDDVFDKLNALNESMGEQ